ncbi:hypothetical protein KCP76_14770 [Salmonella enterica subsp. enterica serovar Weltevreden]|nr:hypothetical protein KCP76_14770 [Salmonella enterica subsp. enterica serovar Weltevreden]
MPPAASVERCRCGLLDTGDGRSARAARRGFAPVRRVGSAVFACCSGRVFICANSLKAGWWRERLIRLMYWFHPAAFYVAALHHLQSRTYVRS